MSRETCKEKEIKGLMRLYHYPTLKAIYKYIDGILSNRRNFYQMKVEDYMSVIGRGWVLICSGEDIDGVGVGDRTVVDGQEFEVSSVERTGNTRQVSIVLCPNTLVPDYFEVGDVFNVMKRRV